MNAIISVYDKNSKAIKPLYQCSFTKFIFQNVLLSKLFAVATRFGGAFPHQASPQMEKFHGSRCNEKYFTGRIARRKDNEMQYVTKYAVIVIKMVAFPSLWVRSWASKAGAGGGNSLFRFSYMVLIK